MENTQANINNFGGNIEEGKPNSQRLVSVLWQVLQYRDIQTSEEHRAAT